MSLMTRESDDQQVNLARIVTLAVHEQVMEPGGRLQ